VTAALMGGALLAADPAGAGGGHGGGGHGGGWNGGGGNGGGRGNGSSPSSRYFALMSYTVSVSWFRT